MMKVKCINSFDGYTIGKVYEAKKDTTSHVYKSLKDNDSVDLYDIVNDYGSPMTFNFKPFPSSDEEDKTTARGGVWSNFIRLSEHRNNKLRQLGI